MQAADALHRHEPRGMAALVEAVAARHRDRLSARRAADGRLGDSDVPVLSRREALERAPGGVRPRRDRRRGGTRGREQRVDGRRARAAPDARLAVVGDGRDPARGVSTVRAATRAAAVLDAARSRLDADRELVHRQRHAARAEPAARGRLGARDVAAAAAAVRRRARARVARRVHLESLAARRRPAVRRRRARPRDARVRRFRSCRPCSGSCSGRWPSSSSAARRRSAKAISRCS